MASDEQKWHTYHLQLEFHIVHQFLNSKLQLVLDDLNKW